MITMEKMEMSREERALYAALEGGIPTVYFGLPKGYLAFRHGERDLDDSDMEDMPLIAVC